MGQCGSEPRKGGPVGASLPEGPNSESNSRKGSTARKGSSFFDQATNILSCGPPRKVHTPPGKAGAPPGAPPALDLSGPEDDEKRVPKPHKVRPYYGWDAIQCLGGRQATGSTQKRVTTPRRSRPKSFDNELGVQRSSKARRSEWAPSPRAASSAASDVATPNSVVSEIRLHHTTGNVHNLRPKAQEDQNHWVDFGNIEEQWTIGVTDTSTGRKTEVWAWNVWTVAKVKETLRKEGHIEIDRLFIQSGSRLVELQDSMQLREFPDLGKRVQLIAKSAAESPTKRDEKSVDTGTAAMESVSPSSNAEFTADAETASSGDSDVTSGRAPSISSSDPALMPRIGEADTQTFPLPASGDLGTRNCLSPSGVDSGATTPLSQMGALGINSPIRAGNGAAMLTTTP